MVQPTPIVPVATSTNSLRDIPQPGAEDVSRQANPIEPRWIGGATRDGRAYPRIADSCGPDHPDDGEGWEPTLLQTVVTLLIVAVVCFACFAVTA